MRASTGFELAGTKSSRYAKMLCAAAVLLLTGSGVRAQSAQAPAASPQPASEQSHEAVDIKPHLKANADEVVLDLVVRERGRDGVPKLKPDDLVVTDEGTPVKLQDLHLVNVTTDPAKKPLVTIVFDPFHGPIAKSTRELALRMLNVLPISGFRMAVMDFDGRLRLIHGFTEERAPVQSAVTLETESNATVMTSTLSQEVNIVNDEKAEEAKKKAVEQAEKNLIAIAQTGSDPEDHAVPFEDRERARALLDAMESADTLAHQARIPYTVAGLMALVRAQESLRGRRVILYFTSNQHLGTLGDRMLKTVADSAAASGINVYTIDMDATGRQPPHDQMIAMAAGMTPAGKWASTPAGINTSKVMFNTGYNWTNQDDVNMVLDFMRGSGEDSGGGPFEDLHNPMEGVSKETGAAYIDALNGTRRALQEMAQDLSSYYEATFVPAASEYDGRFRKITIKPVRADLSVKGRSGYYALPPGVDPGVKEYELPLLKALSNGKLPHDFDFRATVLRFGELPNGNTNTLAVEVPLAALEIKTDPDTGHEDAHVTLMAQVRDKSGVVVEHYADEIKKRDAKQELEHHGDATIALDHHFISAPGHYTLEVAVRDANSGKTSTQRSEFDVESEPGALAVSDMVLVRAVDPVSVVDLDPLEPLLFSRKKVTPSVGSAVPETGKGPSLFFLLHPDAQSKEALHLEMQIARDGHAGARTPMISLDGVQSAVPYMASLGAKPLPPGDYEVKAFLTQGGKTAVQSQRFHVAGDSTRGGTKARESATVELPSLEPVTMDDSQIALDADEQIAPSQAPAPVQLPISAVSKTDHVLGNDEAHLLIESARQHAMDYDSDVLPNFVCTEVTRRSVDVKGTGKWRLEDTLMEKVEYHGKVEARTMLEVNGQTTNATRETMKGTLSTGEFGGVLQAVFRPASQAAFTWKGSATLNNGAAQGGVQGTVQVYDYFVNRANSSFSVMTGDGRQVTVGYHGQVYVDEGSRRARRITLIADDLPAGFPTRSTQMSVDYDYVAINGLKYLMPIGAQLQVKRGERETVLNTMEFSDYRRAGAL